MKQAKFLEEILQYKPHEYVFIDESSFDRRTSNRNRAWGIKGGRVIKKVHFLRGIRYVFCTFMPESTEAMQATQSYPRCHYKEASFMWRLSKGPSMDHFSIGLSGIY
jgi:hypothetical protein